MVPAGGRCCDSITHLLRGAALADGRGQAAGHDQTVDVVQLGEVPTVDRQVARLLRHCLDGRDPLARAGQTLQRRTVLLVQRVVGDGCAGTGRLEHPRRFDVLVVADDGAERQQRRPARTPAWAEW